MKIKIMKVADIIPADYNPRVALQPGMEPYEQLKASIGYHGLVSPLIWNERTGLLVGGHQRLTVLKNEGTEEVEVSVVNLNDQEERQLNLALNRIKGDWDFPKLEAMMKNMGLGREDVRITGFSAIELEGLGALEPIEQMPDLTEPGGVGKQKVFMILIRFPSPQACREAITRWGLRNHKGSYSSADWSDLVARFKDWSTVGGEKSE